MRCIGLDEAAQNLGIQPSTLRLWARQGKIESVRLGRRLLFREEALAALVQAGIRSAKRRSDVNGTVKR